MKYLPYQNTNLLDKNKHITPTPSTLHTLMPNYLYLLLAELINQSETKIYMLVQCYMSDSQHNLTRTQ